MQHVADKNLQNGFKKQDRLTSSLEIESLYLENQSIISYPVKCYYKVTEAQENGCAICVAFSVPKKNFKHAVDRNILKRRMREAYRLNYKKMLATMISRKDKKMKLFFIYMGKEILDYRSIEKNIVHIFAELLCHI